MKLYPLQYLLPLMSLMVASCLSFQASQATPEPESKPRFEYLGSLVPTVQAWKTLLPNGKTFISEGHSNEPVRIYYNDVAAPTYDAQRPPPFAEGSVIVKIFVGDGGKFADSNRVFFMRKERQGYNQSAGDWSYGIAHKMKGGGYVFSQTGPLTECIACHAAYREYDDVLTLTRDRQ